MTDEATRTEIEALRILVVAMLVDEARGDPDRVKSIWRALAEQAAMPPLIEEGHNVAPLLRAADLAQDAWVFGASDPQEPSTS